MGKGHRDNHNARKKRGDIAFKKKNKRRSSHHKKKCNLCGTLTRLTKITAGLCPICFED